MVVVHVAAGLVCGFRLRVRSCMEINALHARNRVFGTIYLCTDTYGNWRAAYRAVATVIYSRWSSVYSGAPLR